MLKLSLCGRGRSPRQREGSQAELGPCAHSTEQEAEVHGVKKSIQALFCLPGCLSQQLHPQSGLPWGRQWGEELEPVRSRPGMNHPRPQRPARGLASSRAKEANEQVNEWVSRG